MGIFVLLALASLVALPVHELVHAGAFALLSGFSARICFGFSDWMLYTSAAGVMLPKRRFCVVLLAPTFFGDDGARAGARAAGYATARVVCRRPSPGRMHGRHGLCTHHRAGADGNACGRHGTGHLATSRRVAWSFVLGPQAHGRLQCPNKGGADGSVVNGYTCGVVLEIRHSYRAARDDCE